MAPPIAIHVFAGTDDYTSLTTVSQWKAAFGQKHALAAVVEIDGEAGADVIQQQVTGVIGTPSLFATATLIVVRQPFAITEKAGEQAIEALWAAATPNELVVLLWQRGDPDKRRVLYKRARERILGGTIKWHQSDLPAGNQLTSWMMQRTRQRGVQLQPDAAAYLTQTLVGDPIWSVVNALDLLCTVTSNQSIDRPLAERYVLPRLALDAFGVTDSIVAGNQQRTLRALSRFSLLRNPAMDEGIALLGALTWLIRTSALIKHSSSRKLSPFVVRKLEPFARRVSDDQLAQLWQQAAAADQQVKSGQGDLVAACETLVWSLLGV